MNYFEQTYERKFSQHFHNIFTYITIPEYFIGLNVYVCMFMCVRECVFMCSYICVKFIHVFVCLCVSFSIVHIYIYVIYIIQCYL